MKVIVGVGVPGCGKTTFLKPVAKRDSLVYLNADDIRQELTGEATNHTQEARVWGLLHSRLKSSLKREQGVLIDATYANASNRKRLVKLVKENGATEVMAMWFNIPLNVCIERNANRDRKVPEEIIKSMHDSLTAQPPDLLEGFDAVVEILD